jgi:hypothetical protein
MFLISSSRFRDAIRDRLMCSHRHNQIVPMIHLTIRGPTIEQIPTIENK